MCFLVQPSQELRVFHLTAARYPVKFYYFCFPIDHKHYIGRYCIGFIYGYVIRRLVT